MTIDAGSPGRGLGLLGRLGRASSVVHLLIVLTVIPSIGVPAFGLSFVRDRHDRAQAAEQVARELGNVAALDHLRAAVATEVSTAMTAGAIAALKPPAALLKFLPNGGAVDLAATSRATDAAFAEAARRDLGRVPGGSRALATIKDEILAGREAMSAVTTSGSVQEFRRLFDFSLAQKEQQDTQDLVRRAVQSIGQGSLGIGTPELLTATAQAQAVSAIVLHGGRSVSAFFELRVTGSQDPELLRTLQASTFTFDTLGSELPSLLSPAVRRDWQALQDNPDIKAFRAQSAALIVQAQQDPGSLAPLNLLTLGAAGAGALAISQALSAVLERAVAEGVAVANQERATAASRARTGLMLTVLALLATAVMLVVVGGLIRRRLRELAAAAGRLSSGTLLPMPVHGPREVAIASEGLNDAVVSLREITTKAALIARGDIGSPLLEQPSPGPLGAAMHASFENVVVMVREREAMQQQLAHQAAHDGLTGLANRAETERTLSAAVAQAQRSGGQVGLLFIDLDHFKHVNDTHGHHAGDQVLLAVSHRLTTQLGQSGAACRLGGDEFVAILPDVRDHAQLKDIGERIRDAVREPVFYRDQVLNVGASIGISVWPGTGSADGADHGEGAEGAPADPAEGGLLAPDASALEIAEWMLSRADNAMYRAKSAGRDTVTF